MNPRIAVSGPLGKNRDMRFHIVLCTGHSSSTAVALDNDFRALGAVRGTSFYHHAYDLPELCFRAGELLRRLAKRLRVGIRVLKASRHQTTVCIAGGGRRKDQDVIRECLERLGWCADPNRVRVVDDTWAGLAAGTFSLFGTCAFSGTGAAVFVGDGPKSLSTSHRKFDGLGPVIGDYGSAFQLSVDTFRSFNRAYDRTGAAPRLFHKILEECPEILSIDNIERWFDAIFILDPSEWTIRLADLARVVIREADKPHPDPDARRLIRGAASEMNETLSIALAKFRKASTLPIVFQGGMFEHSHLYRTLVAKHCRRLTRAGVGLARYRPIVGAAIIAARGRRSAITALTESIRLLPAPEQVLLISTDPAAGEVRSGNHPYYA